MLSAHGQQTHFVHSAFIISFWGFLRYEILSQSALFQTTFAQTQHFLQTFLHALVCQQTVTYTILPRDHLSISIETQQ